MYLLFVQFFLNLLYEGKLRCPRCVPLIAKAGGHLRYSCSIQTKSVSGPATSCKERIASACAFGYFFAGVASGVFQLSISLLSLFKYAFTNSSLGPPEWQNT
ncbi:hypothetical protein TIFTF001_025369 [Ficus carica]|uniref:Uncharacterized protein n=1 Tax=Ficus carica TaxID=3494 RepID=A0AA88APS9_FICCA|nr:hypothetical protein TIFTF001_025369 [Ficus carica]